MGHYTYACGHERWVRAGQTWAHLTPSKEGFGLCPYCYKRREESLKAWKSAEERGLPYLQGTPKQRHWAETIRWNIFESLEAMPVPADFLYAEVSKHEQAAWWIQNRFSAEALISARIAIWMTSGVSI